MSTSTTAVGAMAADKAGAVKAAAIASLPQHGVIYHGLEVMGGGSILTGLVLGGAGVTRGGGAGGVIAQAFAL